MGYNWRSPNIRRRPWSNEAIAQEEQRQKEKEDLKRKMKRCEKCGKKKGRPYGRRKTKNA